MLAQIVNIIIGLWLMAAPYALSYDDKGSDNCHIFGPLVITFATVACWEATRGIRKFNIPLGLWLIAAPWVLGYNETLPILNDMVCGALVIVLSLFKGKITESFGGGWKVLWQ